MKKIIWILILAALLVLITGCDDVYEYEHCYCGTTYAHQVEVAGRAHITAPLNINDRDGFNDEFLSTFEHVHHFSYALRDTARHDRIVLWVDAPVRELSFIRLGYVVDGGYRYVSEALFVIDEFSPGEALVLEGHLACHSSIPSTGLSFVDEDGEGHIMFITENMATVCPVCGPIFILGRVGRVIE